MLARISEASLAYNKSMSSTYRFLDSPVGKLLLVADGQGVLTHILFKGDLAPKGATYNENAAPQAVHQLEEYFAGRRHAFDLPLAPQGTEFQRKVWQELSNIPYGETRSYLQIAVAIGKPSATRAVGAANGQNPIPVIIPCHRVIGSDGSLTGYGGGLPIKRKLLELEGLLSPALL